MEFGGAGAARRGVGRRGFVNLTFAAESEDAALDSQEIIALESLELEEVVAPESQEPEEVVTPDLEMEVLPDSQMEAVPDSIAVDSELVPDSVIAHDCVEMVLDSVIAHDSVEMVPDSLPPGAFVCSRCGLVHEDRQAWNRAHSRFRPCSRCQWRSRLLQKRLGPIKS
jgi:hypothetical protein